jgi:hypothetical protein
VDVSTVSADRRRLFLASFLMLFVELVLIRWLGAHIAYLSFFSNFVLLGSFLGIGIGFLAVGRSDWFRRAPLWLGALVFASAVFPVTIDRTGSSLIFFGGFATRGLPIWISLPVVFAAVAATMAAIAQGVARLFQRFPPLEAYRLDVLGSVTGIAVFATLSFVGAPPVVWGAVIVGLFVFLLRPSLKVEHAVAIGLLVGAFGMEALAGSVVWSPYYRINWTQTDEVTQVVVNGIRPSRRPKNVGPRSPRISCPTSGRLNLRSGCWLSVREPAPTSPSRWPRAQGRSMRSRSTRNCMSSDGG